MGRREAEKARIKRQKAYQKQVRQAKREAEALNKKYTEQFNRAVAKRGLSSLAIPQQPYTVVRGEVTLTPGTPKQAWRAVEKQLNNTKDFYTVPLKSYDTLRATQENLGVSKPVFSLKEQKDRGKSDVFMLTEAINKQLEYAAEKGNFSQAANIIMNKAFGGLISQGFREGFEYDGYTGSIDKGYINIKKFAMDFRFNPEEFEQEFQSLSPDEQERTMKILQNMAGNPYGDERSHSLWREAMSQKTEGLGLDPDTYMRVKTTIDSSYVWQAIKALDYDSEQLREDSLKVINNQFSITEEDRQEINKLGANEDWNELFEKFQSLGLI